jgi:hypothetical protein
VASPPHAVWERRSGVRASEQQFSKRPDDHDSEASADAGSHSQWRHVEQPYAAAGQAGPRSMFRPELVLRGGWLLVIVLVAWWLIGAFTG